MDLSADPPGTSGIAAPDRPALEHRILAAVEVALCSDFPTQLVLAFLFVHLGLRPISADGAFDIRYVAPLLLTDTIVLLGLIVLFLRLHGERPGKVFFGDRSWMPEVRAAVPMVFAAFAIAGAVMLTVALVAPWLHTVDENPLEGLLHAPRDAALFALVVILAGGVREEVQRAFILRRFEQSLGGPVIGVIVSSVAFGAGHVVQGADAAVATGLLGAFWGIAYLRRRSIVAPVVSHAAFDLLQIAVYLATGR